MPSMASIRKATMPQYPCIAASNHGARFGR